MVCSNGTLFAHRASGDIDLAINDPERRPPISKLACRAEGSAACGASLESRVVARRTAIEAVFCTKTLWSVRQNVTASSTTPCARDRTVSGERTEPVVRGSHVLVARPTLPAPPGLPRAERKEWRSWNA